MSTARKEGAEITASEVDLTDPAIQEDPYDAYKKLRDMGVYHLPANDMYIVTRYDHIAEIVRDPDNFSENVAAHSKQPYLTNEDVAAVFREKGLQRQPTFMLDPPLHTTYRDLVEPFFMPKNLRKFEPFITRTVDELIDEFAGAGECEFVEAFGFQLPARVIVHLLGLPSEDLPMLKHFAEAWVKPFAMGLPREEQIEAAEIVCDFQHYLIEKIEEKRARPDDGLISALVHATYKDLDGVERNLSIEELDSFLETAVVGGHETTANALSSGMMLYVRNPDQAEILRADSERIKNFVEEVLRLESPTQGMYRATTRDVHFHGALIPKGALVNLRFAAANRDERKFPDADKMDVFRQNAGNHMAFSQGIHHCLGATLARIELNIAFKALFSRMSDVAFAAGHENPRHIPGYTLRALQELHITFNKPG